MLKVYGIPNCDQIKKTQKWLNDHKIKFELHDYKKSGITKKQLTNWCKLIDWETLLNKRSRTWKELCKNELGEKEKSNLTQAKAITLMQQHPTLIKRPVIQKEKIILVGFDSKAFTQKLK